MRTRAVLGSILASAAVLVVGWQAGAAVIVSQAPSTAASQPTTGTGTAPVAAGAADGTYTGSSVTTRYGSVRVAVTTSGGTITDVTAVHLTDADGRSVQISNRAAPILHDEVIASQSAKVGNVGGATYTTQAYLQSLQSALDQAGL